MVEVRDRDHSRQLKTLLDHNFHVTFWGSATGNVEWLIAGLFSDIEWQFRHQCEKESVLQNEFVIPSTLKEKRKNDTAIEPNRREA